MMPAHHDPTACSTAWPRRGDRTAALRRQPDQGFTLIELLVVLAIVGLLGSIALPRYLASVEHARETTLRGTLAVVREAIDRYSADRGHYPADLQALVDARYLHALPEDPFTARRDSWVLLAPPPEDPRSSGLFDIRSGAPGRTRDGRLLADL